LAKRNLETPKALLVVLVASMRLLDG
jgi:hypothetical protein